MDAYSWYRLLDKPFWAPPSWVFGPVWTFLYVIIAVSFGTVFYKAAKRQLPRKIALSFVLNLIFNLAYTPIQFGLQNNILALVDIILVLATLAWSLGLIWPRMRWIAYVNIPYLVWVLIATALQFSITILNF
ncbi:MAG: TspO/MBR family protein [Candidatus Paceibacterota bacterium]|jgi:tryptophan-rich sensory protein